jgi:hypothetical protein
MNQSEYEDFKDYLIKESWDHIFGYELRESIHESFDKIKSYNHLSIDEKILSIFDELSKKEFIIDREDLDQYLSEYKIYLEGEDKEESPIISYIINDYIKIINHDLIKRSKKDISNPDWRYIELEKDKKELLNNLPNDIESRMILLSSILKDDIKNYISLI